ncbi:MAG: AsnC family transcriptional regulator [Thaumarchaeota archaeon]|jgi:DNA-binding Lrp family transcriptional regulator|nr:AsnC family transcriptional regulator [Nitrososphaerota archaeon]
MDEIDLKLLELLKEDGRASYIDLGKQLNLSEAAVRRRVKKLVEDGVIKKFTIEIKERERAMAITLLSTSPNIPTYEVASNISKIKGVEKVYEITGQYDIAVLISAPSIAEVNKVIDEIRKAEGVINTNTVIILREL